MSRLASIAGAGIATVTAVAGVLALPLPTEPPADAAFPPEVTATVTYRHNEQPAGLPNPLVTDRNDSEVWLPQVPALPAGVTYEPVTTLSTTTTTTTLVPPHALCPEIWVPALAVGWPADELPTLDRIAYNESRCLTGLVSSTNDYGVLQINAATWRPLVESHGHTMTDVGNSLPLNLYYGLLVRNEAERIGWCPFQPWHGYSGDYC